MQSTSDSKTNKQLQAQQSAVDFLTPIQVRSRTEEVLEALAGMIEAAGLEIGDRIPAEMDLSKQLGVGRSTIREALNRWEGLGLVKRRRGSGTFLTAHVRPSRGLIPTKTKLEGEGLLRLIEVRRVLEIESVQRAALNSTTQQKEKIKDGYQQIKLLVDAGQNWVEADRTFHNAIHDASGNPIFGQIIDELLDAFNAAKFSDSPFNKPDFGHRSVSLHLDLCNAIVKRQPKKARNAICKILDHVVEDVRELTGAQQ